MLPLKKILSFILLILTIFLTACGSNTVDTLQTPESSKEIKTEGTLEVHFLDVGQSDCILIQTPAGKNMLIDAGNNADADIIKSYLNNHGVRRIDILVGTHPHEDHIGSLDTVIKNYEIGKIYMPKATTTTKTFEDVLAAVKDKGLKITPAVGGKAIDLEKEIKTEIIAPNSDNYEDLNNYSAVIKLTYGNISFLFTGDAEDISENEMLAKKYDLKADVLKVGHHGSNSSTTKSFLAAVNPSFAVISVGKGNDYGHPHKEVLDRLSKAGVKIYRTDESGTVVFTTDGESIEVNTIKTSETASVNKAKIEKQEEPNQSAEEDTTVYITKSGKKYHTDGCHLLNKSKVPVKLSEAKAKGYEPCKSCNPPQ